MKNPFIPGHPNDNIIFIGHKSKLNEICDAVIQNGQSVAIIGEPQMGKTALLNLIQDHDIRAEILQDQLGGFVFSYLDASMTGNELAFGDFWRQVLSPCVKRLALYNNNEFQRSYQKLEEGNFSTGDLKAVIEQIRLSGQKLIILIAEFDSMISRPIHDRQLLFSSIRAFSSTSNGTLAFVISITCDIVTLEKLARPDKDLGSQYFNTFIPIQLGAFDRIAIEEILHKGGLNEEDVDFVEFVAGGHPFFVRTAAILLWDSYNSGQQNNINTREHIARNLAERLKPTLHFIWNRWSPEMRLAFTLIGLNEVPTLVKMKYSMKTLNDNMAHLSDEINDLHNMGYICEDMNINSGWRIYGKVLLWFLLDRINSALNKQDDLGEWLRQNGWNGFLTNKQKEELYGMARTGAKWFAEGALKDSGALLPELMKKSLGL